MYPLPKDDTLHLRHENSSRGALTVHRGTLSSIEEVGFESLKGGGFSGLGATKAKALSPQVLSVSIV